MITTFSIPNKKLTISLILFKMSDNHSPLNYKNSLLPNYIHVKQDQITFSLDLNKKTAGVLSYDPVSDLIFIPRSIEYERDEYIVTRVLEGTYL